MSFLFSTMNVPLLLIIFVVACATPAWIRWYKIFYNRFIKTGILKKKLEQVRDTAEEKVDILKKATENWNNNAEKERQETPGQANTNSVSLARTEDLPYVKIVLKTLALKGDAGMMIQSIADALDASSNEIKSSLTYLEKNNFIEGVPGTMGTKYYLVERGRNYCVKKGYITE